MTVGVCLITHNAKKHLPFCLPALIDSSLKPRILLVNSSSSDGTVELAKKFPIEIAVIPRDQFNHGKTREWARKKLGTDIVVMVTPDAYAVDNEVLTKLTAPLFEKKAICAYSRQIPHKGAPFFESFPRLFNYPETSHIRSLKDFSEYGVYTYFFSNSFGAYVNSALDEIGGFTHTLTGEDTLACAKLLQKGYKVAYVGKALVHHSHSYSLIEEFKRHFDTGLARKLHRELFSQDSNRGKTYIKELFKTCFKENKALLPYAFFHCLSKWLGYNIGKRSTQAPHFFKRALSSQDFYWDSIH